MPPCFCIVPSTISGKQLRSTLWCRPYTSGLTMTFISPSSSSMVGDMDSRAVGGPCQITT